MRAFSEALWTALDRRTSNESEATGGARSLLSEDDAPELWGDCIDEDAQRVLGVCLEPIRICPHMLTCSETLCDALTCYTSCRPRTPDYPALHAMCTPCRQCDTACAASKHCTASPFVVSKGDASPRE